MTAGYHVQDELDRARTRSERELSVRNAVEVFTAPECACLYATPGTDD